MEHTARTVYQVAADPECSLPDGSLLMEIHAELYRFPSPYTTLAERERAAARWSTEQASRYRALAEGVEASTRRSLLARRAVLGCAPLASLSGAWLQWLTSPGNADDPTALRILSLYADDVGVGRPHASRGSVFLSLLRHFELFEHAAPAARLAFDQQISDTAFAVPALLLAMSRRPDDLRPEILGADLFLRSVGLLPALALVRAEASLAVDWTALDAGTARQHSWAPADLCRLSTETMPTERITLGFDWAFGALSESHEHLYTELEASLEPAYEMAELMRRRAREGAVYHHRFQLSGRSLSDWLAECQSNPEPFLTALAESELVKPGHAKLSPLVNGLVLDRGPMFRVFTADDLAVIQRWIDALPRPATGVPRPPNLTSQPQLPSFSTDPEDGVEPATLRVAYHQLQSRTGNAALRRYCLRYVQRRLARVARDLDTAEMPLPTRWPAEGLRPWLAEQHERHAREFEKTVDAPLPSREALIDSTVQLAPLTLIDGAWLQGFTDYEQAATDIGHALFDTYWDELGNGEPSLNHPLIYRKVLAEMNVQLPPTRSHEFAYWPGFRDESFTLPVFWLCIGRFPRTFLPEVLGLNLAMELSGVGGSYRRGRIALRHHGFSTRFVDIHNTIDNVATGHSAWAADAVDTYLSALPPSTESGARAAAWRRVRTGYRSLTPPKNWFVRTCGRLKEIVDV